MRERLLRAGFEEGVVDEVVAWCRRLGYLDDARFARSWIEYRQLHSPSGRLKLEQELREKGVPADVIADTLATMLPPELEQRLCVEAARQRASRLSDQPQEVRERRLAAFLARRGFSWDLIRAALSQVDTDSDTHYNTPGCT